MGNKKGQPQRKDAQHDFVTAYIRPSRDETLKTETPENQNVAPAHPSNAWQSRLLRDKAVLEEARRQIMFARPEFFCDESLLNNLFFSMRITSGSDEANRRCTFILQSDFLKICVDFAPYDKLVIRCFENGRPTRLSVFSESAIHRYLAKKDLIALSGIQSEFKAPRLLCSNEGGETLNLHEETISEAYGLLARDWQIRAEYKSLTAQCPVNADEITAMIPALIVPASESSAELISAQESITEIVEDDAADLQIEIENSTPESVMLPETEGTFLNIPDEDLLVNAMEVLESENLDCIATTPSITTVPEAILDSAPPAELGLQIGKLIAELTQSLRASDIQRDLATLSQWESQYPGVLSGLEIPTFAKSCLASFYAILGNKNLFIDDLDETVLELGVCGGLTEEKAKAEMAQRALEVFMKDLSPQSGSTLKTSRAKKLQSFGRTIGKKPLQESLEFTKSKQLVENIFNRENTLQPKSQRDQDIIRLYADFADWMERN